MSIYTSDFSGPQFGMNSHPDYRDYRDQSPAIADAIAVMPGIVNIAGDEGMSEILITEFVTGNYFRMLGVQPAIGRAFTDDEADYALDIWAGVVPVKIVIGEAEDDPRLSAGIAQPGYLHKVRIG